MYLLINDKKYALTARKVYLTHINYYSIDPIPEDPSVISGVISMYRDDGFLLSEDNADNYERKYLSGAMLVLTNEPEPEPDPEPEPTPSNEWENLQQEVTRMQLDSIEQGQFATDLQLDILTIQAQTQQEEGV